MSVSEMQPQWVRSRRCDSNTCVEAAPIGDTVLLRDSKNPDGPVLRLSRTEWDAFVAGVADGDFAFQ